MKNLMVLMLVLGSYGAYAQHDHAAHDASAKGEQSMVSFKDPKLATAYGHYLHVKDALVSSKGDEAKKGAGELEKSLKDAGASTVALSAASEIAASADMNKQRKAFSTLSNEMATLVKGGKLSAGSLYVEYCPMANNNEGAYWLSNEKEIKNPYFGDMMLTCGSVKETVKP